MSRERSRSRSRERDAPAVAHRCKHDGCWLSAVYGVDMRADPVHCPLHRRPEERNCTYTWCKACYEVVAIYAPPGALVQRCGRCRLPGDVLTYDKRCTVCRAFGNEWGAYGERPHRCINCRRPGDIHLKSRKCEVCNKVRAGYGVRGETPVRCARHRVEGDVRMVYGEAPE